MTPTRMTAALSAVLLLAASLGCKKFLPSHRVERGDQGPAPTRVVWEYQHDRLLSQNVFGGRVAPAPDGGAFVALELLTEGKFGTEKLEALGRDDDDVASADLVVVRLLPTGKVAWAKRFGDEQGDELRTLVADAFGNAFVGGESRGGIGERPPSRTQSTGYLVALDASGNQRWVESYTASPEPADRGEGCEWGASTVVRHAVAHPDGSLTVAGSFCGGLRHGGRTLEQGSGSYLARHEADGRLRWHQRFDAAIDHCAFGADRLRVFVSSPKAPLDVRGKSVAPAVAGNSVWIELGADGTLVQSREFPRSGVIGSIVGMTCSVHGATLVGMRAARKVTSPSILDSRKVQVEPGLAVTHFDADLSERWARVFEQVAAVGAGVVHDLDGSPIVFGTLSTYPSPDLGGGRLVPEKERVLSVAFAQKLNAENGAHLYSLARWRGERNDMRAAARVEGGGLVLLAGLGHGDYLLSPESEKDLGALYVVALEQ